MRSLLFAILLLPVAGSSAAESNLPTTYPSSRYTAMMEQSPFVLATVVEAPKTPTESFAANWELTGIAKLRDEKGVDHDFVTVRSRDRRISFTLHGDEVSHDPDANGVSIASVDRVATSRKSSVMLKRGTETAKVEFGQESTPPAAAPLQQMRTGAQPQMQNGVPAAYNANPGVNTLGGNRGVGQLRPPGSGQPNPSLIPPGLLVPNANPGVNGAAVNEAPKRRVRVIHSQ